MVADLSPLLELIVAQLEQLDPNDGEELDRAASWFAERSMGLHGPATRQVGEIVARLLDAMRDGVAPRHGARAVQEAVNAGGTDAEILARIDTHLTDLRRETE